LIKHIIFDLTSLDGARVAVQGFGQVGEVVANEFHAAGALIIAVSDSQGAIYATQGLDLAAVKAFKLEHGTVVGMPNTLTITNEEILEVECDILVPAATGDQIRGDNASRINAKLIVEAANRPVTPKADEILALRGVHLLPDILANAGGVTVSYFEWVQNHENEQWDLDTVNKKLQLKMQNAVDHVVERWHSLIGESGQTTSQTPVENPAEATANRIEVDLRTAALVVAVERVARATLERGIWP
jgi:glutamate dehydrogenase (NAD(P)+)